MRTLHVGGSTNAAAILESLALVIPFSAYLMRVRMSLAINVTNLSAAASARVGMEVSQAGTFSLGVTQGTFGLLDRGGTSLCGMQTVLQTSVGSLTLGPWGMVQEFSTMSTKLVKNNVLYCHVYNSGFAAGQTYSDFWLDFEP